MPPETVRRQNPADGPTGIVVASYGQRGIVELADAVRMPYVLKGRKLRVVCGDAVTCRAQSGSDPLVVTKLQPRRNALERPNGRGRTEALAANIDQVVVVMAAEPEPDYFMVDRFLCAAELMSATAVLAINKIDIERPADSDLTDYATLGYPLVFASAVSELGIHELAAQLTDGVSILVGQSGVGKSSLINRLVPNAELLTGVLSTGSGEGKHTTTAASMHTLASGGRLIDSPGVREYAPAIADATRIQAGFREIVAEADRCRFGNCEHTREPNCAVKAAVAAGRISERRYASYKRLRNMHTASTPQPG